VPGRTLDERVPADTLRVVADGHTVIDDRLGPGAGQLTFSAVSSMTNDVWRVEPSVPVNLRVTVWPA
jgi:hypothetical protein